LLSCGESPDANSPVFSPVAAAIRWTLLAVESDTRICEPSGEIAMWSARWPSMGKRQTIFWVFRSIPTTSAKLGRDT
jgi:hypothetical protein